MSPKVPVEYKGLFHGNNYIVNVMCAYRGCDFMDIARKKTKFKK